MNTHSEPKLYIVELYDPQGDPIFTCSAELKDLHSARRMAKIAARSKHLPAKMYAVKDAENKCLDFNWLSKV